MTFVLALGIMMIAACAYLLAELVTLPARQRRASMVRASAYLDGEAGLTLGSLDDQGNGILRGASRLAEQLSPPKMLDNIQQRLAEAGLVGRISPGAFMFIKVCMCVGGVAVGAILGGHSGNTMRGILLALAFGAALFILPDRVLSHRVRSRKDSMAADLPDALDLLAICVEAGLSLDGALGQVVEHMEGPLSDEFAQTLGEIRVGEGRQEALRRLADRANLPSMAALARAVIQSDQLGMPLGRVLRIQARDVRIQRQQAAEERAAKMPIKMLMPTALFIFPVLFFVVVGPAFIELLKIF
jgi:tight adherence protein C